MRDATLLRTLACLAVVATSTACLEDDHDLDGDGIPADEEEALGLDPFDSDTDGDGLSDGEELDGVTDPLLPDTDEDGFLDGTEVALGLDPVDRDSDGDGLFDLTEWQLGTRPDDPDTDGDGLSDGAEVDAASDALLPDTDGDGILDGVEVDLGLDPADPDSDDDGLEDGQETVEGTSPTNPDTDTDGFLDGDEVALQSNPTDLYSWPYDGDAWPRRQPYAPSGPYGYDVGDTLDDVILVDQFGENLRLHRLTGYVLRLDLLVVDDPLSRQIGDEAQARWEVDRGRGLITVQVLFEPGQPDDTLTVAEWESDFDPTFPVLSGTGSGFASTAAFGDVFDRTGPTTILVDRALTLRAIYPDAEALGAELDATLDQLLDE